MIARALLIALAFACASALSPLTATGDDSDCALYLTGPGRTSAYDYSINLLKGNFGYEGQHTCITYDAVNQAYLEARNRILVSQPKGDWKPEDFASVGELVLDISINLARRYGLTYEEIEKGLPLIDTSRTLIREVCPPVFSHVECRAGKYRRLDGLCNNLQHPTWGATNAPFQRLIGPLFSDGINAPRISHTGRDLPLSRVVSRTMHPDEGFHDHAGTVMVIAWGQFMDHDYTLTGTPLDPINRNDPEECCKRPPHLKHPYCNEIRIPDDDYFYRLFGVKCIDFVRGFPSPRPGCRLGSRIPFNTLTGAIDGNTVYGVTEKFGRKLRTGFGGLLRMNPVFEEYGLKDLLPLKLDIPDEGCTRPNKNMYCFEAGEIRVNEQLVLTVMHTLMAREHNRVARGLAEVNPHWDDETLYQEARRINIAEIQHITYNEFLPILLGKDVMEKFGLVLEKEGYWDGYDPQVNPDVLASFAAAAYRFGHSLLPTAVERWSKAHKFIASKRLSDLIRRPYDLYRAGVLDEYVMGLMNQVAQAMDDSITQEVTNHLFKKVGARFGMDLVSFNMQRGREFGLPGYMEFRKFCGLPGADTFQDLFGSMTNQTVRKYETIFEHPVDVDLWSGGVSERPLPGSMLGPTFACIIATQFSYSRRGDRFWFELPNQPSSFTREQLAEIRKSRLARVICDNTDIIDTVQLYPMVLPDHELNPRVPCRSGIIPQMDFSKWAEPAPFHGPAKQFITDALINTNSNGQIETVNNNFKIADNTCEEHNVTIEENFNCSNETVDPGIVSQNQNCDVIQLPSNSDCSNNTLHNNTNLTKDEMNKTESQNSINAITDSDTILKYVYKKNENIKIPRKSQGHNKNSLKRRRRSADAQNEYVNTQNHKAPLVIDYETSHVPNKNEEIWLPARNTANVIKNSNLADFNIETVHGIAVNDKILHENDKKPKASFELYQDNKGSSESEEYRSNNEKKRSSQEIDESDERDHIKNIESYQDNSRENNENDYTRNTNNKHSNLVENSKENLESGELNEPHYSNYTNSVEQKDSKDSRESNERNNYIESNKLSYAKPREESKEKNELRVENNDATNLRRSSDNSQENDEENIKSNPKERNYYKNEPGTGVNITLPINIQDVDLEDFSYERIKVNQNGKIEATKDTHENIDNDSAVETLHSTTSKPLENLKNTDEFDSLSRGNVDSSSSIENNRESIIPVNINDGEIKPVVEINSETDSGESDEENTKEPINDKDQSLESFLGIKETESNEKNEKIVEKDDTGDVKQQFERIPLNYNYDNKQQNLTNELKSSDAGNTEKRKGEGTLDELTPVDHQYDEKLNIKFDDLTIKLPEIKLPDDILAYAYEEPFYGKPKKNDRPKQKFYTYSGEEDASKEQDEQNKKGDKQLDTNDTDKYNRYKSGHKEKENYNEESFYGKRKEEDRPKQRFYNYSDEEEESKEVGEQNKKGDEKYNDDNSDTYYEYNSGLKEKENYKNKPKINEDDDEEEDLYEKFVRERFGKRDSFQKRSEKLQDSRVKPHDPQLYKTIQSVLKKTEEVERDADKSGDPKAGYMWTLEYGENA